MRIEQYIHLLGLFICTVHISMRNVPNVRNCKSSLFCMSGSAQFILSLHVNAFEEGTKRILSEICKPFGRHIHSFSSVAPIELNQDDKMVINLYFFPFERFRPVRSDECAWDMHMPTYSLYSVFCSSQAPPNENPNNHNEYSFSLYSRRYAHRT